MFVKLVFALAATAGALALLVNQRPGQRPRFDVAGTATVTAGLFSLVYGLKHAQTTSWGNTTTVAFLAAALLGGFVAIERRSSHPLLPMRVVADRDRGASFLSIGIAAAANQQVGGSVGVALLSTVAASATRGFGGGGAHTQALLEAATVHGYTTAFMWSAGIFALGAIVAAVVFRPGVRVGDATVQPALAH
jgi:hypothetical protein